MKKIGITLLTAVVGGAIAIGSYKLIEDKVADSRSLEEKQKVYFAHDRLLIPSSAGDADFVQAAAAVTLAVVHIKTTYQGRSARSGVPFQDMFEDFFGGWGMPPAPLMASGSGVIISD